jgi:plastocyanin
VTVNRSLTIFCITAVLVFPAAVGAANLTGRVSVVPPSGRNADHSGVVVWLEPSNASSQTAQQSAGAAPAPATMIQKKQTFQPHVLAVQAGTAVDFPNSDPIFHNVFSNYDGQVFDLQLYAPQASRRVVFRRVGIVRIFCNIHESMSAIVAVLTTPYFAVTGPDGRFEIRAPAGTYRLRVWHERSVPRKLQELERTVTLADANFNAGDIAVSEDGYAPQSHKNKYGQSYSAAPEEAFFYPGGRR